MWLESGDLNNMSRMDEFADHNRGHFSLTGWAETGSLGGMLLQPVPLCIGEVILDWSFQSNL
jgi:hypothetical protein